MRHVRLGAAQTTDGRIQELHGSVASGSVASCSAVRSNIDTRAVGDRRDLPPLVSKVHAEARRFAREGFTVALIGHAGHEEVEGALGEAPESTVLVETAADVAALSPADPSKVAYLMQTTLAVDEATDVAGALRERFPSMRAPGSDDICYATTNRQAAVPHRRRGSGPGAGARAGRTPPTRCGW